LLWKTSLALFLLLRAQGPVTREVHLMGTRSVLATYAEDELKAQRQLENHLRILEETEGELSVWRPDTALSRLNAQPVSAPFPAPARLVDLMEELQFWWKETGGAFDPAIGRLLDARGFYGRKPRATAPPVVFGMQHLRMEKDTSRIVRTADVWIDSGAFGKGEGLDRVYRESKARGASPWLIDLGGQVMVYGLPPDRAYWTVDIAHPRKRDEAVFSLRLTSGSISSSGNSEQPGHILDPSTGKPVMVEGSVVVWHERALIADILSTALFVMGHEKGIAWAEARSIAACFLIPDTAGLEKRATKAFSKIFDTANQD
jgi:thiamine biosynthesis lipoprotein